MAQDVVINGTTYPAVESVALSDADGNVTMYYPDAVRYNPQTLTDEQKTQARENIGASDKTSVPNSATVNEDNELVMQHTEGDAVAELFKVALPAGGSEWEEVAGITTEEEVVSITIPLTKDDAMKISNAGNVNLVGWVKASKEETYTEHGTLTVAIRNVRANGSVMVDYKFFENDTAVPRSDLSYITLASVSAKVENDGVAWISRIVKRIAVQNQTATVKDMGYATKAIGFDSQSTTFEIKIDSSIKMGATTSFSISVK